MHTTMLLVVQAHTSLSPCLSESTCVLLCYCTTYQVVTNHVLPYTYVTTLVQHKSDIDKPRQTYTEETGVGGCL